MIPIKKIFFILIVFTLSCRHSEKAEYTFPKNLNGWAAIVFNCPEGGTQVKNENGIQFIIPKNKILLLSFNRSKGILHDKYFVVDEGGVKKEIFEITKDVSPSDSSLYIRGKILVNKYVDEKNLDKKYSIVYLNLSSQYSTSTNEKEFHEFEDEVAKYIISCEN